MWRDNDRQKLRAALGLCGVARRRPCRRRPRVCCTYPRVCGGRFKQSSSSGKRENKIVSGMGLIFTHSRKILGACAGCRGDGRGERAEGVSSRRAKRTSGANTSRKSFKGLEDNVIRKAKDTENTAPRGTSLEAAEPGTKGPPGLPQKIPRRAVPQNARLSRRASIPPPIIKFF